MTALPKLKPKQEEIVELSHVAFVRVTEGEHRLMSRVAREAGLSLTSWAREALTKAAVADARRMKLVDEKSPKPSSDEAAEARKVFDSYLEARAIYYKRKNGRRPSSVPTYSNTVKKVIRTALREYGFEKCEAAVRGLFLSPHHTGKNDQNREYLDIKLAFRPNNIESFAGAVLELRAARTTP